MDQPPTRFGFLTEQWTAPRLDRLIQRHFGTRLNPRYLNDWTRRHGVPLQVPARQAKEHDEIPIAGWHRYQWPRIKKGLKT